jgi:hypothetical protein
MTHAEIVARINRLTKLSAGLAEEAGRSRRTPTEASIRREIQEYLTAIRDPQKAVDRAWIALSKLSYKPRGSS